MAAAKGGSTTSIRLCLIIGSVMHLVGLVIYGRLPYLYLFSVLPLSIAYYLHLQKKQYRPFVSFSFWGMVIVLSIPIVGLIAGIQKMLMIPEKGEQPIKRDKKVVTVVTLLLFIPIAVFYAAMIMPAFLGASPITMKVILVVAGAAELGLLVALIVFKRRSNEN